jgi:hypothetical protein
VNTDKEYNIEVGQTQNIEPYAIINGCSLFTEDAFSTNSLISNKTN